MTLNGVMAVILRYFSEFGSLMGVGAGLYMCDVVKKSSRSLSHLLMSSCTNGSPKIIMSAAATQGGHNKHESANSLAVTLGRIRLSDLDSDSQ